MLPPKMPRAAKQRTSSLGQEGVKCTCKVAQRTTGANNHSLVLKGAHWQAPRQGMHDQHSWGHMKYIHLPSRTPAPSAVQRVSCVHVKTSVALGNFQDTRVRTVSSNSGGSSMLAELSVQACRTGAAAPCGVHQEVVIITMWCIQGGSSAADAGLQVTDP